jgi:FMN phosphatase YigB (HAD superfamily)
MIEAILFDLDGTLLPLEFDPFFARYFERVCRFYQNSIGADLGPALKAAVGTMMRNEGSRRNAEVFWSALEQQVGHDRSVLDHWYTTFIAQEGTQLGAGVVPDPSAGRVVAAWRARGAKVVLATNPVFPRLFLDLRMRWGALEPESFDLVTCYEAMSYCKPRPEYYREVADLIGVPASECLMVGNDVRMDLAPAAEAGMRTCLVTGPYMVRGKTPFTPDHECTLSEVGAIP